MANFCKGKDCEASTMQRDGFEKGLCDCCWNKKNGTECDCSLCQKGKEEQPMRKYLVTVKNVEFLQDQTIEAKNKVQAEEKWYERWNDGHIPVVDSETIISEIKEIKE